MNESDRPDFAKAMAHLFSNYGDEVTDNLLNSWWGALRAHPLRELLWAMNRHATDPAYGHRRPTLSDVMRHLTETLPAERRRIKNARMAEARTRIQPLEDELYRIEADLRVKVIRPEDVPAAEARINGLRMQIGAMHREAGIDDSPRIERDAAQSLQLLTQHFPATKDPA